MICLSSPQIKYKNMEAKIVKLLESSIVLAAQSSSNRSTGTNNAEVKSALAEALNKAKDASSLDRILHHEQDKQGENVFHNFDLTYAVSSAAFPKAALTITVSILNAFHFYPYLSGILQSGRAIREQ